MLVELSEALTWAEQHHLAVAAVNTPIFESLTAAIRVAERHDTPIILAHAQSHEGINRIEDIGPAMVALARRSSVPCVVHVDHGEDLDYLQKGLDVGFNSFMLDGSRLSFEENIAITSAAVELVGPHGVEGELGVMTGNENGDPSQGVADSALFTDPAVAGEFVKRTGVTALAAAFGTVHGLYHREPRLNLGLITQLREITGVPIVMHGGSGLSIEEYQQSIRHGVRKINYYTYSVKAALDATRTMLTDDPEVLVFSDVAARASHAIEKDVEAFATALTAS